MYNAETVHVGFSVFRLREMESLFLPNAAQYLICDMMQFQELR